MITCYDPKADCPGFEDLGHYVPYIDVDAMRFLARYVLRRDEPARICEIGAFCGVSTMVFTQEIHRARGNMGGIVNSIDPWADGCETDPEETRNGESVFEAWRRNVKRYSHAAISNYFDRSKSEDAACLFPDGIFDLVFIDGDHSYEAVKSDIRNYLPKVRDGGILAGHDFGQFEGVTQAVLEEGLDGSMGTVWWRIAGREPFSRISNVE